MKLSSREIILLALYVKHRDRREYSNVIHCRHINEVSRRSDREFDLDVSGDEYITDQESSRKICTWSAWLPLGAIGCLVNWGHPEVARMCDFGNLDAGWSAIRDSEETTIWRMFERFAVGEERRIVGVPTLASANFFDTKPMRTGQ